MDKMPITEEMHLEEKWFKDAKKQTTETLPDFMNHVLNDYEHDYVTICHAVTACALAAAYAANHSDQGGITGFQAGFVMLNFVRQWEFPDNKTTIRVTDFDNMLYPQCENRFEKKISKDTWWLLQKEAQRLLIEDNKKGGCAHKDVVEHWQSIVDGTVPFGYSIRED